MDARRPGVALPARFLTMPQLILELGLRMNPPTPIDTEEEGIRCTLSFAKQPFQCVLPWASIWAIIGKRDGFGYQWAEDIPPEIIAIPQPPPPPQMPPALRSIRMAQPKQETPVEAASAAEETTSEGVAEKHPTLVEEKSTAVETASDTPTIVKDTPSAESPPEEKVEEVTNPPAEGKKKRAWPSHLRVIK